VNAEFTRNQNYLSKIFFSCIFRFFSSALLDEAAAADEEDEASAGVAIDATLGRFAGGAWADSSSSSYQQQGQDKIMDHYGL
jgi:hypothetical protein